MRRQLIDEKAPAIARRSDFCYPAQVWRQEGGEPESGPGQLPAQEG